MEIRNLKTFIKVAELESFSKAATDLGYAQSTVTTQVQALENELGVPLFVRNGKHVTLSSAGKELLFFSYRITSYESAAVEHFSGVTEPQGLLTVGVMETLCSSEHSRFFLQYLKQFPQVDLKTVIATSLQCIEMLDQGLFDVIITVDKLLSRPNWETGHSCPAKIWFFCSADHPFANRKDVSLEEVIEETFIQIEEGCNYREEFEQYIKEQNLKLNRVIELGHAKMIIDAVADNIGISLLPRFTLEEALREKRIAHFEIKDYSIPMFLQVIYGKNRWLTPAMRVFVEMASNYFIPELYYGEF